MTSVFNRVAIVMFVLGILVIATLSFTKTSGAIFDDCGRWWEGGLSEAEIDEISISDEEEQFYDSVDPGLADRSRGVLAGNEDCLDAQGERRTMVLWTAGATLVLPAGLVFIGRGTRQTPAS